MSSSTKVFIIKNQYVAEEAADDVKVFLENSKAIFNDKPDIVHVNSPFNADGLKCPTFVVPGGSMMPLQTSVAKMFTAFRNSKVRENFNFVGSCAGAMLGADAEIFTRAPSYRYLFSHQNDATKLIDDYRAIGAFCPVESVYPVTLQGDNIDIPFSVSLDMPGFRRSSKQLLINGPGFFAVKPPEERTSDVVAIYSDKKNHEFRTKTRTITIEKMPAAISRKPTETRGGVFLSGTHFYASVENSKMLSACKETSKSVQGLPEDDYSGLTDLAERENTRIAVELLLRRTLK